MANRISHKEEILRVPFNKFNAGMSDLLNQVIDDGTVLGVTYNNSVIAVLRTKLLLFLEQIRNREIFCPISQNIQSLQFLKTC